MFIMVKLIGETRSSRLNNLLLLLLIGLNCSCSAQIDSCDYHLDSFDLKTSNFIGRFKNNNERNVWSIYGRKIKGDYYSDIVIVDERKIAVYLIKGAVFANKCGEEKLPFERKNFYGYQIEVLGSDYFVLQPFWLESVSQKGADSIMIGWNNERKLFEVILNP